MKHLTITLFLVFSSSMVFGQSMFIPKGVGQELQFSYDKDSDPYTTIRSSRLSSMTFVSFGIGRDLFLGLGFNMGKTEFAVEESLQSDIFSTKLIGGSVFAQKNHTIMEKWNIGYSLGLDYWRSNGGYERKHANGQVLDQTMEQFDIYGCNARFILGRNFKRSALNMKIPLLDITYQKGLKGETVLNQESERIQAEFGSFWVFQVQFLYNFR